MFLKSLWFLVSVTVILSTAGSPFDIRIGGIFDVEQEELEIAFKHAVDNINAERFLYPHHLVALTERIHDDNEFLVSQTVCYLLSTGVFAIFGPTSRSSSHYVQSVCDTMEMPHVDTRWNFRQQRGSCLVNIYPYPPVLAQVYVDIVKAFNWKAFTIVYENDDSLPRINELLKMYDNKGYAVTLKQLDTNGSGNYRPALRELKKSDQTYFVIDCSIEILEDVLKQALQVGLMSDYYNFIITNPDLHTLDLFPYQHGGSNITGIQLLNPDDDNVRLISKELQDEKRNVRHNFPLTIHPEQKLRLETALIYDAVRLFAHGLHHLSVSKRIEPKELFCNESSSWEHGYSLINYIRTNSVNGLTGNVRFDYQGFRSEFNLNIVELTANGLHKIGTWNSTEGLNISRPQMRNTYIEEEGNLHNKSFVVLIALTAPYGMLKKASQKLTGNDRFEGFGIDLIHELSLMTGFNYTFKLQEDGQYGSKDLKTGEWNGMIRELLDWRADLAITDLTITSEREEAVDFTHPFMNLGISILYKKPMKLPPSLFSFMSPFSREVWYYLGGAYAGVSLMLYLLARISPAEWTNRYPCIEEPEYLENQFSFRNCFWFTLGSLMQQGSELAPIAISTRMVAGTWWFFTLIMVSSYTANLAAFLTVESLSSPFKSVEELANQNIIKYGAKKGGATSNFFRNSSYSTYQKIWKFMEENPDMLTLTNPEGVTRSEKENYAFFMESTTIEYTIERHCNLTQIGRLLDDKGYGIAMRKNSSYRHSLSTAVLHLQETGKLSRLKTRWWKEKHGGGACMSDDTGGEATELGLPNVGGVFFVLVVGSFAGLLIGIIEMLMDVFKITIRNKSNFKDELKEELKFLFKFKQHTKTVRSRKSRANSGQSFDGFDHDSYGFVPNLTKNVVQR